MYAQFFELGKSHWGQVVFQCRVRPGAFREASGTLGGKHWPEGVCLDPGFNSLSKIEWLIENPADVVVCGLMLREFGIQASPDLYGNLATAVVAGDVGPEFEWTKLLFASYKANGFILLE